MTKLTKWRGPSKDSDQPGHLPSLIRVFVVCSLGSYGPKTRFLHVDSEDWSDWTDAQADLNLCWAHRSFCWFCRAMAQLLTILHTRLIMKKIWWSESEKKKLIRVSSNQMPFDVLVNDDLLSIQHPLHLSHNMTKPTKWVCAQRRLRSAWASPQSDQSLCCPHEESLGP